MDSPTKDAEDVDTLIELVRTHRKAGRTAADPRLRIDYETLRFNIDKLLDAISVPASTDARISFLVRQSVRILKNQEKIMADISGLQAAVADLGTSATAAEQAVLAAVEEANKAIADLTAQVEALSVGQITQEQIDELTAGVEAADQSVDNIAAAVTPVVTGEEPPAETPPAETPAV